jgi:hypothetical protein
MHASEGAPDALVRRWHHPYAYFGRSYLGVLETPIDCAANAYQGLDLNETVLIRFVGLGFFTELFLVVFFDIVPPINDPPRALLIP